MKHARAAIRFGVMPGRALSAHDDFGEFRTSRSNKRKSYFRPDRVDKRHRRSGPRPAVLACRRPYRHAINLPDVMHRRPHDLKPLNSTSPHFRHSPSFYPSPSFFFVPQLSPLFIVLYPFIFPSNLPPFCHFFLLFFFFSFSFFFFFFSL